MSSIVNNDPAVTLFLTLFLLFLLRTSLRGPSPSSWIGLTLASLGAILTKANAVSLLPTAVIVLPIAFTMRKERTSGKWLVLGLFLMLIIGVLLGWESWNSHLRGHWASTSGAIGNVIVPTLLRGPSHWITGFDWSELWSSYVYAHITFWASFGWGSIPVANWIYWTLFFTVAAAAVGILANLCQDTNSKKRFGIAILLLFCLFSFLLPSYLVLVTGHAGMFPGRYVLPIVAPLAILLAIGLSHFFSGHYRYGLPTALALGLFALSASVPFCYLAPIYARPTVITNRNLLPSEDSFSFGDKIILHGFEAPDDGIQPGHTEEFALYWEATETILENYSVDIQVLDANRRFRGATRTYPGRGTFPTSLWEPGEIYRDIYRIDIGKDMPAPSLAQLRVSLYNRETLEQLPVRTGDGRDSETAAIFSRLRAYPAESKGARSENPLTIYGDSIELIDCQLPDEITPEESFAISLQWRCREAPHREYNVFVHLVDSQGSIIDQADGPPRDGTYPTDLWLSGDLVNERRHLSVSSPAHEEPYHLKIGLYDPSNMQRLTARTPDGHTLLNNSYVSEELVMRPR